MNKKVHDQIVSFIWSIADDVLRDVFVRGKYRDIILPFTVLRRLDALLVPTHAAVLEAVAFMEKEKIDSKDALKSITKYPFWNTSKYTFERLLDDSGNIDSNLEVYLDGFSPNVQEIISKFKLRNQLETMKENEITYLLIEKFASKEVNLSPEEALNGKGEKMPKLTNLGMGYVFEELIRKFNEENNEEAGEHFTPREIIKLMTHILFLPVKDKIGKGTYLVYDPACGSGGMLTEAEQFAHAVTEDKAKFLLYGQEVNPETYAICTSDMLIKDEKPENIAFGSTLSKDGFPNIKFDFMLSNPPYGKSWKLDEDAIVADRGKKGKEHVKDHRFQIGLPTISDGQLLFLMNMVSKMKTDTDLGSRIATVHNGSALFTGDAGSGESEIRRYLIERDWLECIIALPTNIFYNTGIPTYVWIVSNRKAEHRRGKVQLINALNTFEKLRKNYGDKNCELTKEHIDDITQQYLDFKDSETSKIYPNAYFGFNKITVERPLRLSAKFTEEAIETLRFDNQIREEMAWAYKKFGEAIYSNLKDYEVQLKEYLKKNEIKLRPNNRKNLFSQKFWKEQLEVLSAAKIMKEKIGEEQHDDFNVFAELVSKTTKDLKLKLDPKAKKNILNAVSWKNEDAERVIKKKDKDGMIHYEPDSDLQETEKVPLGEDIQTYFQREVLQYVPDAWIDESKTAVGYEIAFGRYFHSFSPPKMSDVNLNIQPYTNYSNTEFDYLDTLPEGWKVLPNISIFAERNTKNSGLTELLSVTITSGVVKQSETDKNDTSNSDKSKYKLVESGDIVYNRMRMWQGAVGVSKYEGIASPAYIVIRPIQNLDPEYFHYQFRAGFYVNQSKRFSYGLCDDMLSLRYSDFKRMYSIVPPIETQKEIASVLRQLDTYLDEKLKGFQRILGRKIVLYSNPIENSFYDFIVWNLVTGRLKPSSISQDYLESLIDKLFISDSKALVN